MADDAPVGSGWGAPVQAVDPAAMIPGPTVTLPPTGSDWGMPLTGGAYTPPPPPTWEGTTKTYAGLTPRALLEANPIDLGANLYGVAADAYNRAYGLQPPTAANKNLGTGLSPGWIPPGRMIANALGLPVPQDRGQAAYSTGVGMVGGGLMSGGLEGFLGGGLRGAGRGVATAAGQIPGLAATGAATGALGYDLPPWAQVGIGLGIGTGAGYTIPGMRSGGNQYAISLRDAATRGDTDIPTAAVGPVGARLVYNAAGLPGSRIGSDVPQTFNQWANRGARDIGANTMDNGRLTPSVIADSNATINGLYNDVRKGAAPVPAATGSAFDNGIMTLHHDMTNNALTPQPAVENLIYNLVGAVDPKTGTIAGDKAVQLLQGGSQLDNLVRSPDPETSGYARQLKTILENATTSVMPKDVLAKWKQADTYYKNQQTYLDARTDTAGTITPQSLSAQAMAHEQYLGYGGGAPGENARIGQQFGLKPQDTSTPIRTGLFQAGHTAAGPLSGAALMEGLSALHGGTLLDPHAAMWGAALGYPALAAAGRGLRAFSGAPNPPGGLLYYSRLAANPGLWAQANQPNQGGQ